MPDRAAERALAEPQETEAANKQWFVDAVVTVYAPDIFKAHREAEILLANNLPKDQTTWGIVRVSDHLGDDDDA
jgi:hypothetical protein